MAGTKNSENANPNLSLYDKSRSVPAEAKKLIESGRLKGKTDINPMFRIKRMTEIFGPCGFGWKYEIVKQWQETYGQEVKAFTNINLFFKQNDQWSEPIPGTGGASLVAIESKGPYVSDEGFKMSLTDALSVAMKALGIAADVYYEKDMMNFESKYETGSQNTAPQPQAPQQPKAPAPAPKPQAPSAPQQPQAPSQASAPQAAPPVTPQPASVPAPATLSSAKDDIEKAQSVAELMDIWGRHPELQKVKDFRDALAAKKTQFDTPAQ